MGYNEAPSTATILSCNVASCSGCDLEFKSIRIKPRVKVGADILIIADSPTQKESFDKEGWTDPSYKIIRSMIRDLGITDRVNLTYSVKCWNSEKVTVNGKSWNKTIPATAQAVRSCGWQLDLFIKKHRPAAIVVLGSRALKSLMGSKAAIKNFNSVSDQFIDWGDGESLDFKLIATEHPSSIYKTGKDINIFSIKNDIRKVVDAVDGTDSSPKVCDYTFVVPSWMSIEDFKLVATPPWANEEERDPKWDPYRDLISTDLKFISFEDAMSILRSTSTTDSIYVDIESNSLNPFLETSEVASLGFALDRNMGYVLPVMHHDFDYLFDQDESLKEKAYLDLYEMLSVVVSRINVWHNASYDVRYLTAVMKKRTGMDVQFWANYKRNLRPGVSCTLQKHFLCYPLSNHSMDAIASQLGYKSHKGLYDKFKSEIHKGPKMDYSTHAFWIMGPYNCWDCGVTAHIDNFLVDEMNLRPHIQKMWRDRYIGFLHSYIRISGNGMKIQPENVEIARQYNVDKITQADKEVYFNPLVTNWLVERRGLSRLAEGNTLSLSDLGRDLNLGSGPQVSSLLFGLSGMGAEGTLEALDTEEYGLGFDRSLTTRGTKCFSVNEDALTALIKGYDEIKESCTFKTFIETDEDGIDIYDVTSAGLVDVYNRSVSRGIPKDRVLAKLAKFARPHIVTNIRIGRQHKKALSTYIPTVEGTSKSKIDQMIVGGMARPDFKVHGTRTGRSSSFFHTITNDKMTKKQFGSSFGDEGIIVGADQGQIEARIAGALACDPALCRIFKTGGDIHTMVAANYYRKPASEVTQNERRFVKSIHFGVIYRRGAEALSENLMGMGMTKKDALGFAQSFIDSYWNEYHYLYEWRERLYNDIKRTGWAVASNIELQNNIHKGFRRKTVNYVILTPFGRETQYPKGEFKNSLLRLTCNYPIQSTAADITTSAAERIERRLLVEGFRSRVVHVIHDAVYVDCYLPELQAVRVIIKEEMVRTDLYESWMNGVPLVTDIEKGRTWGELVSEKEEQLKVGVRLGAGGVAR